MQDEEATRGPDTAANGSLLGHYATIEVQENGPMGDTFTAHDVHQRRTVRIRRIRAQQDDEHAGTARQARERMAHEYRVAGLFAQPIPGFLHVYEFATEPDGTTLLVTEEAPGGTLRERLIGNALSPHAAALDIAADVATALAAAHGKGVIHRNLKPANIRFGADGRARVADFGLAQVGNMHPSGWQHPGTPLYVSPEQETTSTPLTPASDQYALGLVLFEMLTGAKYRRLDAGRAADMLAALADDLRGLVARMLAAEPAGRFSSLAAVATEIARIRGEQPALRGEAARGTFPGQVSNVSQMSEPVPADTAQAAPPMQMQEMEPGQGDLRRLAEPIPDAATSQRTTYPAYEAGQADEMEHLAGPMPHAPEPIALAPQRFGPRRGLLQPVMGRFAAIHAGVTMRDGTVSARFLNPGDAAITQWTVGFAFRETPGAAYYLCGVNARGEWFVTAGRHDAASAAAPWEIGKSDAIQTTEDGINTLALTLAGDTAQLAVNGAAVAAVNLAAFAPFVINAADARGDVAITAQCTEMGADSSEGGDTSVLYDRWIVIVAP